MPVKSMLKIVAVKVNCVCASLRTNVAVPKDAGLGVTRSDRVGINGGGS